MTITCVYPGCGYEAAIGTVLCPSHVQTAQATMKRKMEMEELGPRIDRRCWVVQTLIASLQDERGGKGAVGHELEQQEHELLSLLRRERELQNANPDSGEAAADQTAESHDQ